MTHVLRIFLGFLFCLAAILKGSDPEAFQQEILAYQMINYPLSFLVAYWLPAFELMIGIGLVFRIEYRTVLSLCLVLLALFTAALIWTWVIGLDISCGCFGPIDFATGQPSAIVRDIILMTIAGGLLWKDIKATE